MAPSNSKIVELHQPCPQCDSSDAYCKYEDGHGYCFSCEYYHPSSLSQGEGSSEFTYQSLPWRNISANTFSLFGALQKVDADGKPLSISFRYPNGDYKVRLLDKKEFFWIKSGSAEKPGLFGQDKFSAGESKYVIICEGELDAASTYEVLHIPSVSVQSASTALADCTVARSWLQGFERVYLAFDADAAGRRATTNVAKLFEPNRVFHVKWTKYKDANEYLQHGEAEELRNIFWNSKKYIPETIVSSFSDFKKLLEKAPKVGVPYPFKCLTDATYGIRTGETVLIIGEEKIGKTELMHAIELKLLQETEENVGSIFLEEDAQRHLQALAGIQLQRPIHLPGHDCSIDQKMGALQEILKRDDRLFIYTNFGSNDPDDILDTIRFLVSACNCRYVGLDNFSMAISGYTGEDERRKLDYLASQLERMVLELDFALIAVSHVNDEGKTRGSRFLTKIFNTVIRAERNLMSTNDIEKQTMYLSIPYQRFGSKTGAVGKVLFDPDTYSYREIFDVGYQDHEKTI